MGIYLLAACWTRDKEGGLGVVEKGSLGPVRCCLCLLGWRVNPKKQQNWKQYALSMLMLGMVTMLLAYGLYRIQDILPPPSEPAGGSGRIVSGQERRHWCSRP